VTLSGEGVGNLGSSSKGDGVEYRRTRVWKALVTERRKLTIDRDLKISADGDGPTVGARVLVLLNKARDVRRAGFAAEVSAPAIERVTKSTGAELRELAKGSRLSSGNGSDASRMTSWQRTPPSLHLTETGEPLAQRPLTATVGHTGEVVVSPLSVIVVLSEDSEDGEQSNGGNVGLRGGAANEPDTERRRHGRKFSSTEISGSAGRGPTGTDELGLGGNRGERGGCESSS
jgi:hypothetical protein